MTPESLPILDALMIEVTIDLFAGYGVEVHYLGCGASDPPEDVTVAGVIDFFGDDFRGTLLVAATASFFARTSYLPPPTPHATVLDWAGELANQLLGRLKNRLYGRGITMDVSTPKSLSGAPLSTPKANSTRAYIFRDSEQQIWVRLDVLTSDGVDLAHPRSDGGEAVHEGDLVLF